MKSVSIIIPIFNEEEAIEKNLWGIINSFSRINSAYEIIIIESGSDDSSKRLLNNYKSKNVKVIHEDNRNGWGAAIKLGIKEAVNERISFFPIDNQYSADELTKIINNSIGNIITFRIGSQNTLFRNFQSLVFKKIVNKFLNINFKDINSLKIIDRSYLINNEFANDWEIDQDILLHIHNNEIKYEEIGINLYKRNIGKSKTTFFDIFILLLKIINKKK